MNAEEIIKEYIEQRKTGEDNQLRAAVGRLTADRSKELGDSIRGLNIAVPTAIYTLEKAINASAKEMINSNERLSQSNEKYSKAMKWLTAALFAAALVQAGATIWSAYLQKNYLEFEKQKWGQERQKQEARDNCIRNGHENCP